MTTRIGVNGFGRIGRAYLRYVLTTGEGDVEVVAINDVADSATLVRLLRYDSTFGPWPLDAEDLGEAIVLDGRKIAVSAVRDPAPGFMTTVHAYTNDRSVELTKIVAL